MRKYTPTEQIEAFWRKVNMLGDNQCWEWQGGINPDGYGNYQIKGKTRGSHKWAYEFTFGPIHDGLFVLHKCDNRKCCNPSHLFLGTHQDNMDDMAKKGRRFTMLGDANFAHLHPEIRQGERNGRAKLSAEQVLEIRKRYSNEKISQATLAKEFGVHQSVISLIILRKTWKHTE
jgi:hypothetical protein